MDALIKRFFSSDKPDAATPEQDGLNSPSLPTPSSELILAVIPRELINIIFRTLTDGDVLFFRCSCRSARRLCLLIRPNILELCKHKIFSYAAVSVPLLEWSVKSHRIKFKGKVAEEALVAAAAGGHLESLRWIKKTTKCLVPPAASIEAARMGHLAILQDLRHVAEPALIAAAHEGHLAVVKHLTVERKLQTFLDNALTAAIRRRHYKVGRFLIEHHGQRTGRGTAHVMCAAAATGNIVLLELLHTNSYRITPYTIDCAVAAGHLDAVLWLAEKSPMEISAVTAAAENGRLHILKYLVQTKGLQADEITVNAAAQIGDMEMLKFLFEEVRCPVQFEAAIIAAVTTDQLEAVQYIFSKKSDQVWPGGVVRCATRSGSAKVLAYFAEQKVVDTDLLK